MTVKLLSHGAGAKYLKQQQEKRKHAASSVPQSPKKGAHHGMGDKRDNTSINSPLHWACYKGHDEIVWVLLKYGYSALDVDDCGNNSLHLAAGKISIYLYMNIHLGE